MARSLLFGCYEVPGWGGASTATYRLVEMMREQGEQASYLNLVDEQDLDYFGYVYGRECGNPRGHDYVHTCALRGRLYDPHPELTEVLNDLAPDVVVGVGDIAALLMKRARPQSTAVLLTSGCQQLKEAILQGKARDFLELSAQLARSRRRPQILHQRERETIVLCELVMAHSPMTLDLYRRYFPAYAGKFHEEVIWFAEWIHRDALPYIDLARPFSERDIDVLFVSNSWERVEKNYPLVKTLVAGMPGATVHVVGEVRERLRGATHHGLLTRREDVFALMGRAKAVVSPSLFDTAPGILFEASLMGCNLVASQNCGNWQVCNESLLAEPFTAAEFHRRISIAVHTKLEDKLSVFLGSRSYEKLLDTLLAI